jgi:hypothetical protein
MKYTTFGVTGWWRWHGKLVWQLLQIQQLLQLSNGQYFPNTHIIEKL